MSDQNYLGETSAFPAHDGPSSVYQVQSDPSGQRGSEPQSKARLGGPFAIALVTALVAGGGAVSLVCVDELKLLADIEKTIKRKLERVIVPGFEPDPNARPEPLRKPREARPPRQQQGGQRSGQAAPGQRGGQRGGQGQPQGQSPRPQGQRDGNVRPASPATPNGNSRPADGNRPDGAVRRRRRPSRPGPQSQG